MRFSEFKLFEAVQQQNYYTVGDSHAEGLAAYTGKPWINKAKHSMKSTESMHMAAINSIPSGSVVVISLGANDAVATNDAPQTIASRVASIVNASVAKKNKTIFLLFPVGTSSRTDPKRRQAVRDAIRGAVSVPIIDLEGSALQSDGVHAQPNVYASLGKKIARQNVPAVDQGGKPNQDVYPGDKNKPLDAERLTSIDIPKYRREPAVADIQKVLLALGYKLPEHGVDGIRGKETMAAIREFQKDYGLKIDGVPGEETVGKLNELLKSKPNVFKNVTKSTAADVKRYAFEPSADTPTDADKVKPIDATADTAEARKVAEQYVGRKLTDEDWSWLLRTLAGESASNPKSYAWCAAVILNRTHNPGKFRASGSSIRDIVMAPFQFEAVTGRKGRGYNPNSGVANGPNKRQTAMIVDGIVNELPSVPKNYIGFTATNLKIYGSDKGRQFALSKINHPSAVTIAGTVFTTV